MTFARGSIMSQDAMIRHQSDQVKSSSVGFVRMRKT